MARPKRIMTDERILIVEEHRTAGRSIQWIANHLGCSKSCVSFICLKYGIDPPDNSRKPLPQTKPGPRVVRRGNHQVRSFSPEEDAALLELEGKGLMTLARHDERRIAASLEQGEGMCGL